jgi:hypothetical protein
MGFHRGPKIVTDGLVLYLDAANPKSYVSGSTTWNDLSGYGNHTTLYNGPIYTNENNGAIIFDGVNDYGVLGITEGLDANNITLNVIARIPQNNQAALLYLFNRSDYLCIGNFTGGIQGPPNGESFSMLKTNPVNQTSVVRGGEYRFMDNIYHDFTFTRSNDTDTFYVDGIQVGQFTNSQVIASQLYPIEIGQRMSSVYFKTLTSSTYKIYNRALTPEEVLQNYNATKTRFNL